MLESKILAYIVEAALAEDIGRGDLTTQLLIPDHCTAQATFTAREPLITCGTNVIRMVFDTLDVTVDINLFAQDGDILEAGDHLARISGPAQAILTGERTALNIMQRMSGVATETRRYVDAIEGTGAILLDTRKTMPALRALDKYSVLVGGGQNHRLRLDDGILIKDNHIALHGSIASAVAIARKNAPSLTKIEVECDTLDQVQDALAAKADVIMLDNMTPGQLRDAVKLVNGAIPLEASGNVSLDTIRTIAETGVDYISCGRLTHSARAVDIGLDIALEGAV